VSAIGLGPQPRDGDQPLRFSDVIDELQRIAALAGSNEAGGVEIVAACRRAESLLARLRSQFLDDVLADPVVADASVA
jgi:hypothetical protein